MKTIPHTRFAALAGFLLMCICLLPIPSPAQTMRHTSRSGLEYLARIPEDRTQPAPLLILLHGMGSQETDLFSLAPQVPATWYVVSVRAPDRIGADQYRWYEAKWNGTAIAIQTAEAKRSRDLLLALIQEIQGAFPIDTTRIIAAGFSQGANMAQYLACTAPETFTGFASFSGRYVPEFFPPAADAARVRHLTAFLSHGTQDQLLPISYALEHQRKLTELGIEVQFCQDNEGHTISPRQFQAFLVWLKGLRG